MGPVAGGGAVTVVGGAERAERAEASEVRLEAGMGSISLRCLMPRTREALSGRATTDCESGPGRSTVT